MPRSLFEVQGLRVAVFDQDRSMRDQPGPEIADKGTTVVMATHDPKAIEFVDVAHFVESGTLHLPDRDELSLWLTQGTALEKR